MTRTRVSIVAALAFVMLAVGGAAHANRGRSLRIKGAIAAELNRLGVFPPNAAHAPYTFEDVYVRTRLAKAQPLGAEKRNVSFWLKSGVRGTARTSQPLFSRPPQGPLNVTDIKVTKLPWTLPSQTP